MFFSDTIRLFLDSIGRNEEYEFYLKKFKSDRSACFSILCPDLDSMRKAVDVIELNLRFLLKLELIPTVLLCGPGAEEMNAILINSFIEKTEPLRPVKSVKLERAEIFGSDEELHAALNVVTDLKQEKLPVIITSNFSLPTVLERISPMISNRILFIRMYGALKDKSGKDISLYRVRKNQPEISQNDVHLREIALNLLDLQAGTHIAVCSPFDLLKEIFTVKGAGTIIRTGSNINRYTDLSEIDVKRLTALLRDSFNRQLADEQFFNKIDYFYIEENYRGAVLLEKHHAGTYLSKFAVGTQAQGEGTAQELWEVVTAEHTSLFWRSRDNKFINRWYSRLASGRHTEMGWNIFWRGIKRVDIPQVIEYCLNRPEDFKEK